MKDIIADSNEAIKSTNMCNLVTLTNLSDLTKSTKVTRYIANGYKVSRNQPLLTKMTVTIINAILTQNRKVFIFNKSILTELIKNDPNHYNQLGFSSDNYRRLLAHLNSFLCDLKKVTRKGHYVTIGTVTHKSVLKLLTSDLDVQTKEVLEFINKESVGELYTKDTPIDPSKSKFRKIVKE